MPHALNNRSVIGSYRIIDFVGAGGMGSVYRVVHRDSGQVAAAKILNESAVGKNGLERFRNEARIHQSLTHPNIARMFEYVEVDGLPCLIMEYVDGESLDERLQKYGALNVAEAIQVFTALAHAVSYIHKYDIIHRDLKTNNIRISSNGTVKLLDFGIATNSGSPRLTSTGNVVGTLQSLAPEQLRTGRAELRSDIWALGIVFYEMLTGVPPFSVTAPGLLGEHILLGNYTPPSTQRPEVPRELDRVIAKCLRVKPEDRYQSVDLLIKDISRTGETARKAASQWRLGLAALSAVIMLGFFINALPDNDDIHNNKQHNNLLVSGDSTTSTDASTHNIRTVIVRTLEGEADVYRNGVFVGTTPYQLQAPLGADISFTLKKQGCEDTPIQLRMVEGMDAVMESMKNCRNP